MNFVRKLISNKVLILDLIGLASLFGFTFFTCFMAIVGKGALVYYYEPNKTIWISEIFLAMIGFVYFFRNVKVILKEWI